MDADSCSYASSFGLLEPVTKPCCPQKSRLERRLRPPIPIIPNGSEESRRHCENCGARGSPARRCDTDPACHCASGHGCGHLCVAVHGEASGRRTKRHFCRPCEARPGDYDLCSHRAVDRREARNLRYDEEFPVAGQHAAGWSELRNPSSLRSGRSRDQSGSKLPNSKASAPPADIWATLAPRSSHVVSGARSAASMATLGRARCSKACRAALPP